MATKAYSLVVNDEDEAGFRIVTLVSPTSPRIPQLSTGAQRSGTDHPANSRVIYDTVSHPDISGASWPNFGYNYSSDERDNNPKVVQHSVTLTGLSPNTKYYFRVLSIGSPLVISDQFTGNSSDNEDNDDEDNSDENSFTSR